MTDVLAGSEHVHRPEPHDRTDRRWVRQTVRARIDREPGHTDGLARRRNPEIITPMAALETKLAVLTWMVGFLIALVIGNLWLSVSILARLAK